MKPAKAFGRHSSGAFTLIELLFVVAIIAVLAILILGAASYVKEASRAATCISNLRALGAGFTSFCNDNNGFYPDGDRGGLWPTRIEKYVDRKRFFCPVAIEWEKGDAYFSKTVVKIPDDKAWADLISRISYGYNSGGLAPDIGHRWNPPNPDPRIIKISNTPRPVVLLVDAGRLYADGKRGYGFYVAQPEKAAYSMPLPRHFDKANFLWTDGHIDQRYCDPTPSADEPYKYTSYADWDPRKDP